MYTMNDDKTLSLNSSLTITITQEGYVTSRPTSSLYRDCKQQNIMKNKVQADEKDASVGSSDACTASTASSESEESFSKWPPPTREEGNGTFEVGDHVYRWCSHLGIPFAYQHHGIVTDVSTEFFTILDFYSVVNNGEEEKDNDDAKEKNRNRFRGSASTSFRCESSTELKGGRGMLSEYNVYESQSKTEWKKVEYGAGLPERILRRAGTCSSVEADIVGLVLARADFLLENSHLIPPYHVTKSNCECVAVWCKTGHFCSLQGTAALTASAGGAIGSASAMGVSAAAATTTVPAAGVWGWFGFTSTVPLTVTLPWLIPAIAAYGVYATAAPVAMLMSCENAWKETTESLNLVLTDCNLRGMFLPHCPTYDV